MLGMAIIRAKQRNKGNDNVDNNDEDPHVYTCEEIADLKQDYNYFCDNGTCKECTKQNYIDWCNFNRQRAIQNTPYTGIPACIFGNKLACQQTNPNSYYDQYNLSCYTGSWSAYQ